MRERESCERSRAGARERGRKEGRKRGREGGREGGREERRKEGRERGSHRDGGMEWESHVELRARVVQHGEERKREEQRYCLACLQMRPTGEARRRGE